MNLSDELSDLERRRQAGMISHQQFEDAKARLLHGTSGPDPMGGNGGLDPLEKETRLWGMLLHLSLLLGHSVAPIAGLIVPVVIWQWKKNDLPGIDAHGKNAVNWIISELIYVAICIPLIFVLIGFPLLIVLVILGVVFPIIAGIKANNGEIWRYPLSIGFLK